VKIYAVAIQKGGTGKTATAANLAAGLAIAGRRVLAVDADPQGHLT
jgi:chromosome partitioning protein